MDEETRRNVCRLIAGMVVVDDELDVAEDAFVDRMLERFGLSSDEREALFPIMDAKEAAAELRALPAEVQHEAFDLLVEAAAVDGQFVAEERVYLLSVAEVLGIDAEEVDRRVRAAIGHE